MIFPSFSEKPFKAETTKMMAAGVMGACLIYGVLPVFGFGSFALRGGNMFCWSGNREGAFDSVYLAMSLAFILGTILAMGIGYSAIYSHMEKTLAKGATGDAAKKNHAIAMKMLVLFSTVTIFFICFWTPVALGFFLELIGVDIMVHNEAFQYACIFGGSLSSTCNPFIYGLMNRKINEAMRKTAHDLCPCLAGCLSKKGRVGSESAALSTDPHENSEDSG
jgi:hypothetical protein